MNKFAHFLVCFAASFLSSAESQRVGYIGPACAVTDDSLFLNGEFVRKMEPNEMREFYRYQGALQVRKQLQEAVDKGVANVSASNLALLQRIGPSLSDFCGANLDDSIEIVLRKNCIVRNGSLHNAKGIVVRPLTLTEREKIDRIIGEGSWKKERKEKEEEHNGRVRRSRRTSLPSKADEVQDGITDLIGHLFNVNESVARRFIPMAKSSPFLANLNYKLLEALSTNGSVEGERGKGLKNDSVAVKNSEDGRKIERREELTKDKHQPLIKRRRRNAVGRAERKEEGKGMVDAKKELFLLEDDAGGIPHLILGAQQEEQQQQSAGNNYYGTGTGFSSLSDNMMDPFVHHLFQQYQRVSSGNNGQSQMTAEQPVGQASLQQTGMGWPQQQFSAFVGGYQPPIDKQQQQLTMATPKVASTATEVNSRAGQIQPGQMVEIGGQTYVAVPLSSVFSAAGFPQKVGMMPMAQQQSQTEQTKWDGYQK